MKKSLLGVKTALLVANGFSEMNMTSAQKALLAVGANVRIVSPENGLVNGWDGQGWGHHFAVDAPLSAALAADYALMVIPGGQRSLDKLNLTAHTKRFISGFMNAGKPVAVMDDAIRLLILTDNMRGRTVSGPASLHDLILQAGGQWSDAPVCADGNLLTGEADSQRGPSYLAAMIDHFTSQSMTEQAA